MDAESENGQKLLLEEIKNDKMHVYDYIPDTKYIYSCELYQGGYGQRIKTRDSRRNKRMSKDEYLVTDVPLKALTVFAIPMILGSFFQQVYNMADSIIVGQFVGSSALAAVGACAALTNVFICVALGAGVGAGVLVSRYFGARNYSKMKTIVSTSLISFLILSILLGIFGFGLSQNCSKKPPNPPHE